MTIASIQKGLFSAVQPVSLSSSFREVSFNINYKFHQKLSINTLHSIKPDFQDGPKNRWDLSASHILINFLYPSKLRNL
jgi:hypothetical protein